MPLLNLQTNLKSLQYGKDRPGGGNSGQPYETTPIPGNNDPIDPNSEDFLLRGGLNGARDTFTDLKRLSKFFNDDNSSEGALFVIKQNLLSKIGVRTQASGIGFNEGAYTPLSTLAQAGISIEGGHIPKQGLIPFAGPNTYLEEAVPTLFRKTTIIGEENGKNNRLVQLTQVKIDNSLPWKSKFKSKNQIAKNPNAILSYSGGPSSLIGLLGTRIPFATDPQGAPLRTGVNNSKLIRIGSKEVFITPNTFQPITSDTDPRFTELPLGASNSFNKTTPNNAFTLGVDVNETQGYYLIGQTSVYPSSLPEKPSFEQKDDNLMYSNGSLTLNQEQLYSQLPDQPNKFNPGSSIQDFRKPLIDGKKKSSIMSLAPSYDPGKKKTIDGPKTSRINYTAPGQKGNVIDYSQGKLDENGNKIGPVDRINALPIYKTRSNGLSNSIAENDLIKFRIGAIRTESPSEKEYINFRAYIDSFSDSYNANWNQQKYMGRGEPLYKYDSFNRDINLSFTVAAQSMGEIMIMYRKLNFLASNLAPDYTSAGYMAGPLVQLTMGGWCYELPGFIRSLTLDVPQESPWEIGIPNLDKGTTSVGGISFRDPKLKEMPMICRVTGFSFTPIHTFRPAKQTLGNVTNDDPRGTGAITPEEATTLQDTNTYGVERYISLSNGNSKSNNNYDSIEQ